MIKWAVTCLQMNLASRSLSFLANLAMPLDQKEAVGLFIGAQELGVLHTG